jgi:hypothetical protein
MLFKEPGAAKHARHVANLLSMYALFSEQIGSPMTRLTAAKRFAKRIFVFRLAAKRGRSGFSPILVRLR